jgi:uncharacterized protein (DUF305 family)
MERKKRSNIGLLAATVWGILFAGGCNQQEQALRKRAGWPTTEPTNAAANNSDPRHRTAQPYDMQFIDSMITHHQQAVQMAQLAADKAQHTELKEMARKMVNDQQQEIEQMSTWRGQWFASQQHPISGQGGDQGHQAQPGHQTPQSQPSAQGQATPGRSGSMQSDMSRLQSAAGNEFDLAFLEMMIPHHQDAVRMSQNALVKSERPEIKQLAQKIADEQQKEIATMDQWRNAWKNVREKPLR